MEPIPFEKLSLAEQKEAIHKAIAYFRTIDYITINYIQPALYNSGVVTLSYNGGYHAPIINIVKNPSFVATINDVTLQITIEINGTNLAEIGAGLLAVDKFLQDRDALAAHRKNSPSVSDFLNAIINY